MAKKKVIATGLWMSDGYHGVSMRPVEIVQFYSRPTSDEMNCEFAVIRGPDGPRHFLHLEKREIWALKYVLDIPKRKRKKVTL